MALLRWSRLGGPRPTLAIVVAALAAVLLVVLFVNRRGLERDAREAFLADCASRGASEDDCEDLLDRHHERCFGMSYSGRTRYGRTGRLDLPRYLDCVRVSPSTWLAKRKELLREREREQERRRRELGL